MRSRKLIAIAAGAIVAAGVLAAPASAADSETTFTVTAGTLEIGVVTDGALGSVTSSILGTTASGTLSTVTVTDNRASTAGWTVSASMAADFYAVDGSGLMIDGDSNSEPDYTIASSAATVTAGTGTLEEGTALFTPELTGVTMSTTPGALGSATTTGSNKVSFTNSISIAVPAEAIAGDYKGVVSQTVA